MANGNDGPFLDEGAHMTFRQAQGTGVQISESNVLIPESTARNPESSVQSLQPGPLDADILWLFNLTTGAGIWSHDAAHSSILIHGDYLYLNSSTGVDNTHKRIRTPDAPSLVVLDKRTGRFIARDNEHIAPNIFHNTWSSPSLAEVNGKPLVFFAAGNGVLYAFEPLPSRITRHASRITEDQSLLTSAATPKNEVQTLRKVWQFDFDPAAPKTNVHKYNTNRREGPSNFYGMPVFHQNRIYAAGGGDIWWGKNGAWLKCIAATKTGDITTNGLIWSYPLQKHVLSTPAVYDGLVFIADCGRLFHCVDANTGQPLWTHEIKGDVWASPLVADGKVYLGTRSGNFYIFNAGREKKVLSEMELGNPISGTATAANGVLYVATMTRLYAIQATAK
jgi:outer membrane protein assembly factor BamB